MGAGIKPLGYAKQNRHFQTLGYSLHGNQMRLCKPQRTWEQWMDQARKAEGWGKDIEESQGHQDKPSPPPTLENQGSAY